MQGTSTWKRLHFLPSVALLLGLVLQSCTVLPHDSFDGDETLPPEKILLVGNIQLRDVDERVQYATLITSTEYLKDSDPAMATDPILGFNSYVYAAEEEYKEAMEEGEDPFFYVEVDPKPIHLYQVNYSWSGGNIIYIRSMGVKLRYDLKKKHKAVYIGDIYLNYNEGENSMEIDIKNNIKQAQEYLEKNFDSKLKLTFLKPVHMKDMVHIDLN